ncbi:MAG TPA: sugar ABC transporter ATP-binding protein [Rhodoferax sp.]|nr:sugar ABC transporter ATP-binding protein [Rhodoferax sp.]
MQPAPLDAMTVHALGKDYAAPVLDDVTLSVRRGEVLALAGENGAGKSTLAKIMCGLVAPTRGSMQLGTAAYAPATRRQAEAQGVRMVMQELGLVPTLTVAENLLLDHLPQRAGWLQRDRLRAAALARLKRIGLDDIDPDTPVARLGIGYQQMVEIARALVDDTRMLILDEPTAMLTPREVDKLFTQIERLAAQGVAIVYVSHRLEELQRIADRVAVLRDGRLVDLRAMAGLTEPELVQRMVGRQIALDADRAARPAGPVMLTARRLCRGRVVQDVTLDLRAGEIMGLAGLVGSGRTEVLRLLYGADHADSGELEMPGRPGSALPRSPMAAMREGIGLVTEDRKAQGLLMGQSIQTNATLSDLRAVSHAGWLQFAKARRITQRLIEALRIRCRGPEQAVNALSGGNQQKVVFARWLHRDCRVLLLDEPTRGVDVGARADLYAELEKMTAAGKAVLMVSSDLRELMDVCDRIGVMSAGRLVQTFSRGAWSQEALLAAAFSGYARTTAAMPASGVPS